MSKRRDRTGPIIGLLDVAAMATIGVVGFAGLWTVVPILWMIVHGLFLLIVPDWAAIILSGLVLLGTGYLALRGLALSAAIITAWVVRDMLSEISGSDLM